MRNQVRLFLISLLGMFTLQADWQTDFVNPPDTAKPWVYWYFMDGNLTREGMSADLESMKQAGLGGAIFLEVNVGVPRGPVAFMSKPWQELVGQALRQADDLGLQIALGTGPGWCGAGGPWVQPEMAMQHLVASQTQVMGPMKFDALLPQPPPRKPYFGERSLTPQLHKEWREFYQDVVVLAFPSVPEPTKPGIRDVEEKALYFRDPFSSKPGVKPFLSEDSPMVPPWQCIDPSKILDLSDKMTPDGHLNWQVPAGSWTILRFGRTLTGQTTRPAPKAGLGFETDKFSVEAINRHFASYLGTLLQNIGAPQHPGRGLTTLHFDSWEMGAQNWSAKFREEFTERRGYDPVKFLPTLLGQVVESSEVSERFLWDLRHTAQELIVDYQAKRLKELGHEHGLEFSLEPYDLNPAGDFQLGAVADIPMGEFWSKGWSYPTDFSCIEAASIGHTGGRPIIGAESFTAQGGEDWQQYPGRMKAQGDWAFCCGINKIVFHRFQAQPWLDRFPGMTMGPFGVHWERTQTWWDMVSAYHLYLSRCSQLLREGLFVADVLYLVPEGAPQVFRAPQSALVGYPSDRLGYNFDGCGPENLIDNASVKEGRIVFPDGMSYRLLVLPEFETMTPKLLQKIDQLVEAGATIIGTPPRRSPSLVDYPQCDQKVKEWDFKIWGPNLTTPERPVGKGRVFLDPDYSQPPLTAVGANSPPLPALRDIYPSYGVTSKILEKLGVEPDFQTDGDLRYIHRQSGAVHWYFIASRKGQPQSAVCWFRVSGLKPEWWDPVTGEHRELPNYKEENGLTSVPVRLAAWQSGFMVFREPSTSSSGSGENFPEPQIEQTLVGPWSVAFDPKWGGPAQATFATLDDWTQRPEDGIKYYSGKAVYHLSFDSTNVAKSSRHFISLGTVNDLASVRLNGQELGILWCAPWRLEIPDGLLKVHQNELEITVANLWVNRLIKDSGLPKEKRLTSVIGSCRYKPDSPLQPSGLLGPVTLQDVAVRGD